MKNFSPKSTSRCIESIKLIDGEIPLLSYHQARVDKTIKEVFNAKSEISLKEFLNQTELPSEGLYKIRLIYSCKVHEITVKPYQISHHNRVKLVEANFSYSYKYEDRQALDELVDLEIADDVIYTEGGKLMDAWYSNIALRKKGKWYTPKDCMLNGVKRQMLIDNEKLIPVEISHSSMKSYDAIAFINAMRDFEKIYRFTKKSTVLELTEIIE